jgi:hypothetical protein
VDLLDVHRRVDDVERVRRDEPRGAGRVVGDDGDPARIELARDLAAGAVRAQRTDATRSSLSSMP